jgi:hypothetical protein
MSSKKDTAIKEVLNKEKSRNTFLKHITITDDCHEWTGAKSYNGYGYWAIYSKELGQKVTVKAHRVAYALAYGFDALPDGIFAGDGSQLVINHICENRSCVNPEHLEIITSSQNVKMQTKTRKPRKPNDAIIADNLEDFMEQIRNTVRE